MVPEKRVSRKTRTMARPNGPGLVQGRLFDDADVKTADADEVGGVTASSVEASTVSLGLVGASSRDGVAR